MRRKIFMKKLIAIAVVFALVAGVAFAQTANGIQVQAWGRGAFSPLSVAGPMKVNGETAKVDYWDKDKGSKQEDDKGEVYAGVTPTWGAHQGWSNGLARVDIRINGNSDYVGFGFNGTFENYDFNDNAALIWAKPFGSDILKVTVGQFVDDTLRGKIGNLDGGFSNFVLPYVEEEDAIFQSFAVGSGRGNSVNLGGTDGAGFMISSAPMDGLFIGLLVKGRLADLQTGAGSTLAIDAWRYMHLGAGYNIANIGHARAQFIGGWSGTIDMENLTDDQFDHWVQDPAKGKPGVDPGANPARIELAFALTAVENLLVDLGTKIYLPLEVKNGNASNTWTKGLDLSLGANYNMGAIGLGARLDIQGLGAYKDRAKDDDKHEDGATTVIRLVPTYALEGATVGLDFAVAIKGKDTLANGDPDDNSGGSQVGFGVFVSKGLGNGNIRAGLSFTAAPTGGKDNKANGSDRFQIPIILEYAFF
jgi:hypothetical protein